MRNTFVTNLIRHGVPPSKIQRATRHKSIATPMTYAHYVVRERDPTEAFVGYGVIDRPRMYQPSPPDVYHP